MASNLMVSLRLARWAYWTLKEGLKSSSITATSMEGMGEAEQDTWRSLPHASFDVAIMNPPFTRATGHEAEKMAFLIRCLLPSIPVRRTNG